MWKPKETADLEGQRKRGKSGHVFVRGGTDSKGGDGDEESDGDFYSSNPKKKAAKSKSFPAGRKAKKIS